jgi:hypothetical protein
MSETKAGARATADSLTGMTDRKTRTKAEAKAFRSK